MQQSIFDPFNFFKNFIDFGLRILLFFWIVFGFRNTRLAFWYLQLLAGSTSRELINQIVKLNSQRPKLLQLTQTSINAIEIFLEYSTIGMMNAKAIKDGQFEIGYYSMINGEKLISVNSYIYRLKSALSNGYLSWQISHEEVEKITNILDGYSSFHEPVTASILFVIQTECIHSIGCPLHSWYARAYYRALHNYLSQVSSTEQGACLQKTEIDFLLEKLLKLNIIDQVNVMRFTLEDKETCSIGNTLAYIKGDQ
jgi:hypothetical protein